MSKSIYYKIYDQNNIPVDTFFDFEAGQFSASINSGYSDLTLTIPRPFDYFWQNINFNGYVERYVGDSDAPQGLLTYRGYITERDSFVGDNESSTIRAYGYWSKLSKDFITTGTNLQKTYTNQDTGAIMRDLMTLYKQNNTASKIATPTIQNIPNTGITATYSFNTQTYAEAIIETKNLTGADWYVFLENDNSLRFKQIVTNTADHTFIMGRDIKSARYSEDIDQVINGVYFWNGVQTGSTRIMKRYTDTASINEYGRQFIAHKDGRVTSITTSNLWAARKLGAFSQPLTTLEVEIFDKEFSGEGGSNIDIESIKPGQTFKIANISENAPFANQVFYITQITDMGGEVLRVSSINAARYVDQQIAEMTSRQNRQELGVTYTQPFTT